MLFSYHFKSMCLQLLFYHVINVQSSSATRKPNQPEYVSLPPLRAQATLRDAWTAQRISNIPNILQKYGVDAWLVRLLAIIIDTIFSSVLPDQWSALRPSSDKFIHKQLCYLYQVHFQSVAHSLVYLLNSSPNLSPNSLCSLVASTSPPCPLTNMKSSPPNFNR
jgi:hypothetical protein